MSEEIQYLQVLINSLRQEPKTTPARPKHILTELGVGYRLQLPPDQRA